MQAHIYLETLNSHLKGFLEKSKATSFVEKKKKEAEAKAQWDEEGEHEGVKKTCRGKG